jgi:hypothetical protein
MVCSALIPSAAVLAADDPHFALHPNQSAVAGAHSPNTLPADANKPMTQNYPGGSPPTTADAKAAADAGTGGKASAAAFGTAPASPTFKEQELTDKRTATSQTVRHTDGSLTETHFLTPHFYQPQLDAQGHGIGAWQAIKSDLVEDANAADSTNPFGELLGQAESLVGSPKTFKTEANDWQVRFAPSDDKVGMLRLQQHGQTVTVRPQGARAVTPVLSTTNAGQQVITYTDLWPGIDVSYQLTNTELKEFVSLKSAAAPTSYGFALNGAGLAADPQHPGGFTLTGALTNFGISPLTVERHDQAALVQPASGQAPVVTPTFQNGALTVTVDASWLQGLKPASFPVTIDPSFGSFFGSRSGGNFSTWNSDGQGFLSYQSLPKAGAYWTGSYYQLWRAQFHVPYDQLAGHTLNNATLRLAHIGDNIPGYSYSVSGPRSFQVAYSGCVYPTTFYACYSPPSDDFSFDSQVDVNVTNIYQALLANNDFGGWLAVKGDESGAAESMKTIDPDNSYVVFSYWVTPPTTTMAYPTTADQVFTDPQPSFKVTPQANPNADISNVPLQYQLRVSNNSDGTGSFINSGLLTSTQWTVPDNTLQDGGRYFVSARTYDSSGGGYSAWGPSVSFKIDLREGKDKTQTYDTLGPVTVDLATGNLMTSTTSHTSSALAGSLGVNLDYNSPLKSRPGLVGRYWNNSTFSGAPTLTRVDRALDFDWGSGSPDASIASDNFTVSWDGYFVAPTTGAFQFGGHNDDVMVITVNGTELYRNNGCTASPCWGTEGSTGNGSITLTAGQVVPIHIDYIEVTGASNVQLWVQNTASGANNIPAQVVKTDWLRTGVRPVTSGQGLLGSYYQDPGDHNLNATTKSLFLQRTDPVVGFDWGAGGPVMGGPTDQFMVRWNGYLTVPTTGTYQFGVISDDGARITINNVLTYDNWTDHTTLMQYGNNIYLTAGQAVPISVDYYENAGPANMTLIAQGAAGNSVPSQVVPSSWLSTKAQVLPDGWSLGADPDGQLNYDRAVITQTSVILKDASGDTHTYTATGSGAGSGYRPPVNEDGQLVRNQDGSFTLQDSGGKTYVFAADGTLTSVTTPVDDRQPAALRYEYAGVSSGAPHLLRIKDGVDPTRTATLYYSGDSNCGSAPSGFDPSAPSNMLCAVKTNDGRATSFYYQSGQLARVAKPGNDLTDFMYEQVAAPDGSLAGQRLTGIRDSLANDAIAAGVRANDDSAKTQVAYDSLGRVVTVTQPAAKTGDARIRHSIEYLPGTGAGVAGDGSYLGATQQHIGSVTSSGTYTAMNEPAGYTHRVEYDNLFRTTKDFDVTGLATVTQWDPVKDLALSTTDPAGLMSTTIYDDQDRLIANYGPAPSSWFGADRAPATNESQVPRTDTHYDEGIQGPAAAYFAYGPASKTLVGTPLLHTTNAAGSPAGEIHLPDSSTGPIPNVTSNWGMSLTGKIRLPQDNSYQFRIASDQGVRLWIDDSLIIDDWTDGGFRSHPIGTYQNAANTIHRFRLDYYHQTGNSQMLLMLTPPGGSETTAVAQYVTPAYNLVTSAKTHDSTLGDTTTATNYGANPELGLAQSTTVDPAGLGLTTTAGYEQQGSAGSFLRQTSKTLPGSSASNPSFGYGYYAATDTRDNPCTTGTTEAYKQAGLLRLKTEADPDGAGPLTGRATETIYDDAGNVVATRIIGSNNVADAWTCTSYDSRRRITQTVVPAYTPVTNTPATGAIGSLSPQPARNTTNNYAVSGNPLTVATTDDNGSIITSSDLLGRTVSYTDTYGDVTASSYAQWGRLASRSGPLGSETFVNDSYNRLTDQQLDGTTYAHVTYDAVGRISNVSYPNAGSQQLSLGRDSLGRVNSQSYSLGNNTAGPSNTIARSQSGLVASGTELNQSKTYSYDAAGRLVSATIGGNTYTYGFGSQAASCSGLPGSNVSAGKNSNRTTQAVNGVTTTYCYDQADRLISSSNPLVNNATYDSHGNIVSLGSGSTVTSLGYDASGRNNSIIEGAKSTALTRDAQGRITKRVVSSAQQSSSGLPSPWANTDIGAPAIAGSTTYSGGVFTVKGAGTDVWNNGGSSPDDQFQYAYQNITGDGQIIARVTSQTNTNTWAKAGVVIKASPSLSRSGEAGSELETLS